MLKTILINSLGIVLLCMWHCQENDVGFAPGTTTTGSAKDFLYNSKRGGANTQNDSARRSILMDGMAMILGTGRVANLATPRVSLV